MNYLLAVLIPPLSVAMTGRIFTAIIVLVFWVLAFALFSIVGHAVAVIIVWLLIAAAKRDKQHKDLVRAIKEKTD